MKRRRRSRASSNLNIVRNVPGATDVPGGLESTAPATAQNVRTIAELEQGGLEQRSITQRIADAVARVSGSTASIVFHVVFFGGWIVLNVGVIPGVRDFDPFPFSFLTMIVSLEAIFLSLFILISQNRMSRQAERREHLDLQINLLAEQESTATLRLLRRLCEHAGLDMQLFDEETRDLERKTNVHTLVDELDKKLPSE
jgi:uncharacterized membrane protein